MEFALSHPTSTAMREKGFVRKRFQNKWLWPRVFAVINNMNASDTLEWAKTRDTRDKYTSLRKVYTQAFGLPIYPHRPACTLPSSPSVDLLRQELAKIPKAPVTGDPKDLPRELIFAEAPSKVPGMIDSWVDWSELTFESILTRLVLVLEALGQDAWASVRWEVYDKVRVSPFTFYIASANNFP